MRVVSIDEILNAGILIVDDLSANVQLLEATLRGAGYTAVSSTTNPYDVLGLHETNRYDLILLDLQMPGMDGFEVMKALKTIETDGYVPVLVVTAQPGHKLRALQAGAKDFVSKPIDLVEVKARVHNLIEVRLLHKKARRQADEVKALYDSLLIEQKISERLLLNVLPTAIAERLKLRPDENSRGIPEIIADSFSDVTVLFADIVGFTAFSSGVSPERLVVLLNEIFSDFDTIADRHGLEKVKSIGDAYMAAAGLPIPVDDHAARAAHMALDMLDAFEDFRKRNDLSLQIRIGTHSGPVVAGVIGRRKFIYDLWGASVNIASRMESHSLPGRIQISEATHTRLGPAFRFEARGAVNLKDLGELDTWFLIGRVESADS